MIAFHDCNQQIDISIKLGHNKQNRQTFSSDITEITMCYHLYIVLLASAWLLPLCSFAAHIPSDEKNLTPKQVESKLRKSCWIVVDPNLPRDKHDLSRTSGVECTFGFYGKKDFSSIDWDNEAAQTLGEYMLDAKAKPMRLDYRFYDGGFGQDRVVPGIFKFEGDMLIWAQSTSMDAKVYDAAKGNVPSRPKHFTKPPKVGLIHVLLPAQIE